MHLSVTVDAEPLARPAARTIARRRLALHVLVHGALAALVLVIGSRTLGPWWALAVLGAASAISERFPMPFPGKPGSTTSITPVFVLASGVLFGAPTAMLIGWLSMAIGRLSHRQPVRGALFNASVFALSGGLAALAGGAAAGALGLDGLPADVTRALAATFVFWLANNLLMAPVFVINEGARLWAVALELLREEAAVFGVIASTVCMLVALWERSPFLIATLVGPLAVLVLYQRSLGHTFDALKLAFTDPLTGLGNRRAFRERLDAAIDASEQRGEQVALCLIDVDDFKDVNDQLGHSVGDRLLEEIAALFRVGEAFRIGGDEFALVLAACSLSRATTLTEQLVARVSEMQIEGIETPSVSVGVALYDGHRDSLLRRTDAALYEAKRAGKNVVRAARESSYGRAA